MLWRGILVAFALGLSGCSSSLTFFQCVDDNQCGSGVCEPNEYCSFPDDTCPSGRVYGDEAAPGIAGNCVPVVAPGSTGAPASESTGAELTTDTGSTSVLPDGSTTQIVTTTTGGTSTEGTSSESDEGPDPTSGGEEECSRLGKMECVACATESVCIELGAACTSDPSCVALNECLSTCVDEECGLVCCSASEEKAVAVWNANIECILEACPPLGGAFICP